MTEKWRKFYYGKGFIAFLWVAFFLIPFIVHFESIVAGDILVAGDGLLTGHIQMYMGDSLRNLDFPLWTPYLAGGMPFAQDTSMCAIYPPLWVCSLLPKLLQLYAYFGIHYALGGIFMFLYLQKLNCSRIISLAMSVIYLFTVHMGGARKEHVSLIVAALYLPVILYFIERYLQSKSLKWLFWAAGAMAFQFLGGFLQYVVYSDIVVFAYLLFSGIHRKFPWKQMIKHGAAWFFSYFGLIGIGVLPMLQMLSRLYTSGGSSMPIEFFIGYSLHPMKLVMSLFPRFFGADVWAWGLDKNYSSGMDAELILGAAFITLLLYSFFLWKKSFHVQLALCIAFCTLGYACVGQLPLISKILYYTPILNMFRIPSRTLFLFTFCCVVLGALALQAICDENRNLKRLHLVHGVLSVIMGSAFVTYILKNGITPHPEPLSQIFAIPFAAFGLYLAIFYASLWLRKKKSISTRIFQMVLAFTIMGVTIFQTFPYYKHSYISNLEEHLAVSDQVLEGVESQKIWSTDLQAMPKLLSNTSLAWQTPSLNSYTNFNLPGIYCYTTHSASAPLNYSGLYKYFPNPTHTLQKDNAFLSMMGVKYIATPPQAELEHYQELTDYTLLGMVLEEPEANLAMATGYQLAGWPITLEPDSYYKISFTASALQPTQLYADFADIGYDFQEQEAGFTITEGSHNYGDIIFSGDSTVANNIMFRIVPLTEQDITISEVRVEKIKPEFKELYIPFLQEADYRIYENINAKQLLYVPEKVVPISEEDKTMLYLNTHSYDILNTSYIMDGVEAQDFSDANVQIENIVLTNNTVSAKVSADKPAFINMSQNYYPGWNAYIDGKKTKVYEVNGIIQGVYIPDGEYTLEFKFQPMVFFVGIAVSVATILACWLGYRRSQKQK